jgi:hypothetical protein
MAGKLVSRIQPEKQGLPECGNPPHQAQGPHSVKTYQDQFG